MNLTHLVLTTLLALGGGASSSDRLPDGCDQNAGERWTLIRRNGSLSGFNMISETHTTGEGGLFGGFSPATHEIVAAEPGYESGIFSLYNAEVDPLIRAAFVRIEAGERSGRRLETTPTGTFVVRWNGADPLNCTVVVVRGEE